jgi:hypothetical protein
MYFGIIGNTYCDKNWNILCLGVIKMKDGGEIIKVFYLDIFAGIVSVGKWIQQNKKE